MFAPIDPLPTAPAPDPVRDGQDGAVLERLRAALLRLYPRMLHAASGPAGPVVEATLYEEICAAAAAEGGLALAWIGRLDHASERVEVVAAHGRTDYLADLRIAITPGDPTASGPTATALRERRAVICNDFWAGDTMRPWRERAAAHGFASSASVPLIDDGEAYAVLSLYAAQPHFFCPQVLVVVEQLAATGALIRRVSADGIHRFRQALDGSGLTAFTMDRALTYTWVENPAFGHRSAAMLGRTDADLLPAESARRLLALKRRVVEHGETVAGEVRLAAEGPARWFWLTARPLRDGGGAVAGLAGQMTDISERKRAEQELELALADLHDAQRMADLGSWTRHPQSADVAWSPQMYRILGRDPRRGAPSRTELAAYVHPGDRELVEAAFAAAEGAKTDFELEHRVITDDGSERIVHTVVRPDPRRSGGLIGTLQDITDHKAMEDRLRHLADHDPLTGIYNRRRLIEELERRLQDAARDRRSGAVLLVDLDHLKLINDTHGHRAGDTALRAVVATLTSRVRRTDVVARLGGDEFAVLLPDATCAEARVVAEDIRAGLAREGGGSLLTASIGIVEFTGGEQRSADELLVCGDTALYEAKERGGDTVRVYSGQAAGALQWVRRIRTALAGDGFVLHGQPIIDLRSGRVVKRELLLRMRSPDGQLIFPGAFIPTAERFGLIGELDEWVTRRGLGRARAGESVTINLSGHSVGQAAILDLCREAAGRRLTAGRVTFEITETAAMSNLATAREFVGALTALGYSVALDDFGTGFGSFIHLKHIPARFLKIDMEFVRALASSKTDQHVVRSIVGIAHSLGKLTVAEGVEDERTLELLRDYGVDYAQGFGIGRPAPLAPGSDQLTAAPVEELLR